MRSPVTALVLHVAVVPTPGQDPTRPARERVRAQSAAARVALARAAEAAGCAGLLFGKSADDVPRPSGGWHWSVSHDATFAAGALCRAPVGVDLERVVLRRAALREAVLSPAERELVGAFDALAFTRVWTAKEAVLKAAGVGLGELSRCRLAAPLEEGLVRLEHRGRPCLVRQRLFGGHVLAVHAPGEDWRPRWDLPEAPESPG